MKKKVMVANSSDEFCTQFAEAMQNHENLQLVATANDGEQAIHMLWAQQSDVLVLDMMLPRKDGIAVLQAVGSMEHKPVVIATSKFITDYVATRAADLGAKYLLLEPLDMNLLIERIEECCVENDLRNEFLKNGGTKVETLVTDILHDIGVPAHIKGYQYLREAIIIAVEDMDVLGAAAKVLYSQVAKIFQTTPSRVGRAMQHAIDIVWEKGDHEVIEKHCGYLGDKPEPTRFIEVIVDDIHCQLENNMINENS